MYNQRELRAVERKYRKLHFYCKLLSNLSLLSKFITRISTAKPSFFKAKLEGFHPTLTNPLPHHFSNLLFLLYLLPSPQRTFTPSLIKKSHLSFFKPPFACFTPLSCNPIASPLDLSHDKWLHGNWPCSYGLLVWPSNQMLSHQSLKRPLLTSLI